ASSPAELGGRLVLAGLSNSPFLYGYGAPRALPSFPTRRSSDLAGDAGMASTAKHFPTHAGVRADSHTEAAVDRREYTELLEDLLPYRRLIASGLQSVMAAHVSFPRLDPKPASLSRWWITSQLRGELGFSGAVISDDLS